MSLAVYIIKNIGPDQRNEFLFGQGLYLQFRFCFQTNAHLTLVIKGAVVAAQVEVKGIHTQIVPTPSANKLRYKCLPLRPIA
jgi:hypothetical protein